MGILRCGSSSWSEKAWGNVFYPAGLRPAEWLTYYATRFPVVEADTTYYRVPTPDLVRGWDRKTPAGFSMCAKFPRSIVHAGDGPKPDGEKLLVPQHVRKETEEFLEVMSLLGPKCGPLVLQFPYMSRAAFADSGAFLERLDAYLGSLPGDFRYAVELRNKSWVTPDLCELLRRNDAALCLVDLAYMPHPKTLANEMDLVTTDFVYGRLIGDRKAIDSLTDTLDHVVVDQSRRIDRWTRLLVDLVPRVSETYCFANNHYAGYAPDTIAQLVRALKEKGVEAEKPPGSREPTLFPED